ncbi:MAG: mechanosensitive ion channel family protein [Aquisalinus sp.]|nr:mechanosensitive ion channel family protein [Aquisalinus sp.]
MRFQPTQQASNGFLSPVVEFWDSTRNWLVSQGVGQAAALMTILGLFLGLRIVRGFLTGIIRQKEKPDNTVRNIVAEIINKTWTIFLLILSAKLVVPFFGGFGDSFLQALDIAFMIALIIQGAVWARVLVNAASTGYLQHQGGVDDSASSSAVTLIKMLSGFVIWALAIMMILRNLNYEIGPILAGLGVGGLAIGLAAQNIFRDLFSSIAIIFDRPFVQGDFIKLSSEDTAGNVEKIGMKTTRLRSLTGEQIIVSNSQLLDQEIRNFRRLSERRADHTLGVTYQTSQADLARIPALVEQALAGVETLRFDRCHLKAFGAYSIDFALVFWVGNQDYKAFMDAQQAALLAIAQVFQDNGISFAYPTQVVYVDKADAE